MCKQFSFQMLSAMPFDSGVHTSCLCYPRYLIAHRHKYRQTMQLQAFPIIATASFLLEYLTCAHKFLFFYLYFLAHAHVTVIRKKLKLHCRSNTLIYSYSHTNFLANKTAQITLAGHVFS